MKNKRKILSFIIYILFILILFEIVARLMFNSPNLSRRLWVNESNSWKRSWVQRHKTTGKEIYFTFDVYDSTKGWRTQSNIVDMEVFDNKILNSNSQGLRGKQEYQLQPDHNKTRIFIIGDSYTFGEEVSDDETYPYYLEKLLPTTEIMNFGVHGYGHDQMLISLQEQLPKYRPDIVILGFIESDTKRNMVNFRDYAKPQFKYINKKLTLTSVPVPTPEATLKWDWLRPRIIDVFSIIRFQLREKSGKYAKDRIQIAEALLNEINILCAKHKTTPIFLYIPIISEVHSDEYMVEGEDFLYRFCKENNIRYFSTRPYLMNKAKKGAEYKDRGHWGVEGNYAIAEAIKQYMMETEHINLNNE